MTDVRTEAGAAALAAEAERRVRGGERHADVADSLGVPSSTLSDWARRGGWRRKDLSVERNAARGRIALAEIEELAVRAREEILKSASEARAAASAADTAMDKADPEGDGRPTGLVTVSGPQLSMAMAQKLLQQGRLEEAERAARIALRFAQAEQATNEQLRAEWRQDRARIFQWWEENSSRFMELHRQVVRMAEELEHNVAFERRMAEANCCPTCTRPMDFWPAEMKKEGDRIDEELEAEQP